MNPARGLLLGAALTLGAGPALADRAMLGLLAQGRVFADQPLLRGYALCLLGNGDPAALEALIVRGGGQRLDETEMGATDYMLDANFYISTYQDGTICDVTAERIGTDVAMQSLMVVAGITGFESQPGSACPRLVLGGTVTAELTSSGNDPVCPPAETSNVRFSFGAAAAAPAPALTK